MVVNPAALAWDEDQRSRALAEMTALAGDAAVQRALPTTCGLERQQQP
jgi:hypothetical protein